MLVSSLFFALSLGILSNEVVGFIVTPRVATTRRRLPNSLPLAAATGFGSNKPTTTARKKSKKKKGGGYTTVAGSKALRRAANAYDRLRSAHGPGADVYLRSPLDSATTFWFVGKVAFAPDVATAQTACIAYKRLILEYSQQELRPQNFGGRNAPALELWLAPPDSEMDVVRNSVILEAVKGKAKDLLADDFDMEQVGYNPEIYMGDERAKGGLRVELDEQGRPTKEAFDVNTSA